jgi:hypothetical protein
MPQPIFIFKVALLGEKDIWRRIALKGSDTLEDLHGAIYVAFDRDEEHLYSFYVPPLGGKGTFRSRIRNAAEYTAPYSFEGDSAFGTDAANAGETKIESLGFSPKRKFYYLFDFGDEWWHEITVEKTDAEAEKGKKYPCILEKKGKSPPQYDYEEE